MSTSQFHTTSSLTAFLKSDKAAAVAAVLLLAVGLVSVLLAPAFLPGSVTSSPVAVPALAAGALVSVTVILLRPRWVFYGFLLACIVAPLTLEELSLPLGFMKLYPQDVVFLYSAILIALRSTVGRTSLQQIPFNRLVICHFLLGIWGTAVGLGVTGHAFDYTLGDFRRAFLYFLNYFVIILLTDNLKEVRLLRSLLAAGGTLLILKGLWQVLSGQFYVLRFGDSAHILSHFELTFLSFTFFLAVGNFIFCGGGKRWAWGLVAVGGALATLVGNYRAAWLSLIGGTAFMFFYIPRRGKMILMAFTAALVLCAALAVGFLWDVRVDGHSTLGQDIMAKANVGNTTLDVNVTWRFDSYANALGLWMESPWIGRGLGEELEFSTPTSTGQANMARSHRVHNSFIWLLMSLGLPGFIAFLAIQAVYFRTLLRFLRQTTWVEGKVTVLACAAFYVSFMISTSFEIFLESAMPITVLTASMALAMLTVYYGRVPQPNAA